MDGLTRIEEVLAFVALDPQDNTEGFPAFADRSSGMYVPMVAADQARLESMRPIAEKLAIAQGVPITVVKYSLRTDIEELRPSGSALQRRKL